MRLVLAGGIRKPCSHVWSDPMHGAMHGRRHDAIAEWRPAVSQRGDEKGGPSPGPMREPGAQSSDLSLFSGMMMRSLRSATNGPPGGHPASQGESARAGSAPPYSPHPDRATDHPSHFREDSVRIGDTPARQKSLLSRVPKFLVPVLNFSVMAATLAACEKARLPVAMEATILTSVGVALYRMSEAHLNNMSEEDLQALIEREINRRSGAE